MVDIQAEESFTGVPLNSIEINVPVSKSLAKRCFFVISDARGKAGDLDQILCGFSTDGLGIGRRFFMLHTWLACVPYFFSACGERTFL